MDDGNENQILDVERTLAQIDQPSTQRYTHTRIDRHTQTLVLLYTRTRAHTFKPHSLIHEHDGSVSGNST